MVNMGKHSEKKKDLEAYSLVNPPVWPAVSDKCQALKDIFRFNYTNTYLDVEIRHF